MPRCRWGVGVLWAVFTICHAILTAVLFLEVIIIIFTICHVIITTVLFLEVPPLYDSGWHLTI